MKSYQNKFCLLFSTFLFGCGFYTKGQNLAGTEFWFTFNENSDIDLVENQIVIVSNCVVHGTYSFPALGLAPVPFTIVPNTINTLSVPLHNTQNAEVIANNGLHLTTDKEVTAYAINYQRYSVDGETMLPTNLLGLEYVAMGYSDNANHGPSQMTICATEDSTIVTITPSKDLTNGSGVISHAAGTTWQIILDAGQTYMISGLLNSGSLSGTHIKADKPVVVLSHTVCTFYEYGACDVIMCQTLPYNLWGTRYITGQALLRGGNCGDDIEVCSGSLPVTYNLNDNTFTLQPFTSRVHDAPGNAGSAVIIANGPIQVSQYSHGLQCDYFYNTDPEHIMVYPENMWISDYTLSVSTSSSTEEAGITIIVNSLASGLSGFELDEIPLSSLVWDKIGTSEYFQARIMLTPGPHHVKNINDTPFSFYQFAAAPAESYIVQGGIPYATHGNADFLLDPTVTGELDTIVKTINLTQMADEYRWVVNGSIYSMDFQPEINLSRIRPGLNELCLEVSKLNYCIDTSCRYIDNKMISTIYVPNSFTPDGDNINDVFQVIGTYIKKEGFSLEIFNKWGERIFYSSNLELAWDGTVNGELVKTDLYVWKLNARSSINDQTFEYRGNVSVIY